MAEAKEDKKVNKGGRPRIKIEWDQFDKLCHIQCTLREIASWFDCSEDTIEKACIREKQMGFTAYFQQKAGKGKISLRRKQWDIALSGDKTMLIWLGKQYLYQADKQEVKAEVKTEDKETLESKLEEYKRIYAEQHERKPKSD